MVLLCLVAALVSLRLVAPETCLSSSLFCLACYDDDGRQFVIKAAHW
jgi:hypothetical protein